MLLLGFYYQILKHYGLPKDLTPQFDEFIYKEILFV